MEENVLGKEVAGSNWSGGDKRRGGGGGAFGARQVAMEALQAHAEGGGGVNASFEDYGDEFHSITDDGDEDDSDEDSDEDSDYDDEDEEEVGEVEAVDGQVTVDEDVITTTDEVSRRELTKRARGFFERFRGGRKGRDRARGKGRGSYGSVASASANTLSALLMREPAGLCEFLPFFLWYSFHFVFVSCDV